MCAPWWGRQRGGRGGGGERGRGRTRAEEKGSHKGRNSSKDCQLMMSHAKRTTRTHREPSSKSCILHLFFFFVFPLPQKFSFSSSLKFRFRKCEFFHVIAPPRLPAPCHSGPCRDQAPLGPAARRRRSPPGSRRLWPHRDEDAAIDKLARRSTVFRSAYVQYSFCAPSRNSFMSGESYRRS